MKFCQDVSELDCYFETICCSLEKDLLGEHQYHNIFAASQLARVRHSFMIV